MPRPRIEECVHEAYRRYHAKPLGFRDLISSHHRAIMYDLITDVCNELGIDPLTAPRKDWIYVALALPHKYVAIDYRRYYAWELYFFYHESMGNSQTKTFKYPHRCKSPDCFKLARMT